MARTTKKPSELHEDEQALFFDSENDVFVLFHVANGQLWQASSEDADSFNLPDAEPIETQAADELADRLMFVLERSAKPEADKLTPVGVAQKVAALAVSLASSEIGMEHFSSEVAKVLEQAGWPIK